MTHSHDHLDWAAKGNDLIADAETNAPMIDQALAWLAGRVPGARLVLDIGSGPGVAACTVAKLLPGTSVLAVDGTPELLALARDRARRLGVGDRLATREATLPEGLTGLPPADLVWVSGVAHHLPDPADAVRRLAALVRPGGVLALREGGLPLRCLPPYADAGLTSRMGAIADDLTQRNEHPMGAVNPPRHWPDLLLDAGLSPVVSRSFLLDLPAPLDRRGREGLRRDLQMSRDMLEPHLSAADLTRLDQLTSADDPESVLHRGDAFMLRANTVHTGVRS
jgi:SAM-dependent methyltransferase